MFSYGGVFMHLGSFVYFCYVSDDRYCTRPITYLKSLHVSHTRKKDKINIIVIFFSILFQPE